MISPPSVIFADPDGWRVGRPEGDGASVTEAVVAPPDAPPDVLAAALRVAGYAGRAVLLALPSGACLCATVSTAGLPARNRGQAMLYRLEERLPLSAEDVVADFIPAGPAGALGVCVQRRPFHTLLDTLRGGGVNVVAACPRSLLALQLFSEMSTAKDAADAPADVEMILWADGPHVEAFVVGPDRQPRGWAVLPHDPNDVALHVGMQSLAGGNVGDENARPQRILACGVDPEVLDRLRHSFSGSVVEIPVVDTHALAARAARAVLARQLLPRVDFVQANAAGGAASRRAFAQARGPLAWLATSAAVMALALLVALFWRGARYQRLAAAYEARQQEVFRRAFPGQPLPRDVRSRLASEEQRLRTGGATGASDAPDGARGRPTPAADGLLVLRDIIAGLPTDLRFVVTELRLDAAAGRFTLLGEARSHGDAQAIADALRGGGYGRFAVEPPRTELRAGGDAIGFTITGDVAAGQRPGVAPAATRAEGADVGATFALAADGVNGVKVTSAGASGDGGPP